jgi:hypothetical protein
MGEQAKPTPMGMYLRNLLLDMNYFATRFPRIPVTIEKTIRAELDKHPFGASVDDGADEGLCGFLWVVLRDGSLPCGRAEKPPSSPGYVPDCDLRLALCRAWVISNPPFCFCSFLFFLFLLVLNQSTGVFRWFFAQQEPNSPLAITASAPPFSVTTPPLAFA